MPEVAQGSKIINSSLGKPIQERQQSKVAVESSGVEDLVKAKTDGSDGSPSAVKDEG